MKTASCLGCKACKFWERQIFRKKISPPSSGSKRKANKEGQGVGKLSSAFLAYPTYFCWLLACLIRPWRWRVYPPPKRRALFELHDVTTQKTILAALQDGVNCGELLQMWNTDPDLNWMCCRADHEGYYVTKLSSSTLKGKEITLTSRYMPHNILSQWLPLPRDISTCEWDGFDLFPSSSEFLC
jgi:hypothetical protein